MYRNLSSNFAKDYIFFQLFISFETKTLFTSTFYGKMIKKFWESKKQPYIIIYELYTPILYINFISCSMRYDIESDEIKSYRAHDCNFRA